MDEQVCSQIGLYVQPMSNFFSIRKQVRIIELVTWIKPKPANDSNGQGTQPVNKLFAHNA